MDGLYSTAYVDPFGGLFDPRVPPTDFLVFPLGEFTTEHGSFLFDEESAKTVMEAHVRKGVDATIDYEHQALVDPPIPAPASASRWVPQIRDGALWATEVKWTDKAWMHLSAAEYRYISPAFTHESKAPRRVLEVINLALTNIPAMHGQDALVRATGRPTMKGTAMDPEELKRQIADLTAKLSALATENGKLIAEKADLTTRLSALTGSSTEAVQEIESLTASLSLPASNRTRAARGAAVAELSQLRSNIRSITESDSDSGAIGKIHAWKSDHTEVSRLSARLVEVETKQLTAEFEEIIDKATKGSPAKRDEMRTSILKTAPEGKITRQTVDIARACLSQVTTIPPGAVGQPPTKKPEEGADDPNDAASNRIAEICGPVGGFASSNTGNSAAAAAK